LLSYCIVAIRISKLFSSQCFILGTERCNEALQKLGKKYDIVVNIQGDEPLIEPEIIDGVVKALQVNYYFLLECYFFYTTENAKKLFHKQKNLMIMCIFIMNNLFRSLNKMMNQLFQITHLI